MRFRTFNRFDPAFPICFSDTDDSGGGNDSNSGAEDGGNDNPNKDNKPGKGSSVDLAVQAQLIDLTTEHGSVDAVAKYLIKRNHSLEKATKSALPKGEKEAFDAFKALNMTPAQIAEMKANYGTLTEKEARATKLDGLKQASGAKKTNVDADLLASLSGALDVDYSTEGEGDNAEGFVTVQVDGKPVKKPLLEWIKATYPQSEAKLMATPEAPQRGIRKHGGTPPNSGQSVSVFDQIRERNKAQAKQGERPTLLQKAEAAGMTAK